MSIKLAAFDMRKNETIALGSLACIVSDDIVEIGVVIEGVDEAGCHFGWSCCILSYSHYQVICKVERLYVLVDSDTYTN